MHGGERDFTFRDGERTIRFRPGAAEEALDILGAHGFTDFALLTTPRARRDLPALESAAAVVLDVPHGGVPQAAAAVRGSVEGRPLVSLGGGRVVDAAKAIAGADGLRTAAVPTTLAGSPFTAIHRMPEGVEEWKLVRPALVVADPNLMASMDERPLAATAMNALAHAAESLYGPGASPVTDLAALRAAELFAAGLAPGTLGREQLALAALLGGYAIGLAGLGVHHALGQTIVRTTGTPHAETYAVLLPHTLRFMASRAPEPLARLAAALGREGEGPEAASEAVAELASRSGVTSLGELGLDAGALPAVVAAARQHPALAAMDAPPSDEALRALLESAL